MNLELTAPHFTFRHALKFLWPWTMTPPANQFGSWSREVQCFPLCPATTVNFMPASSATERWTLSYLQV